MKYIVDPLTAVRGTDKEKGLVAALDWGLNPCRNSLCLERKRLRRRDVGGGHLDGDKIGRDIDFTVIVFFVVC